MMDRYAALTEYVMGCRGRPYQPGTFDCALFVAGWVEIVQGVDVAAQWRGAYDTVEDGAAALGEALGVPASQAALTMLQSVAEHVGGWMAAETGDIAVLAGGEMGLIGGPHVHVLHPDGGLNVVPLRMAARVYRP